MFLVYSQKSLLKFPASSQVRSVVITRNKKDNKLLQLRERSKNRRRKLEKHAFKAKPSGPKESVASLWLRRDKERQMAREKSELGQNLKQLQAFTEQLRLNAMKETDEKRRTKVEDEHSVLKDPTSLLTEDVDTLMQNLMEEEKQKALQLPRPQGATTDVSRLFEYVENEALLNLPASLIDKIGDSVKYIRNKNTQNWELMIRDMSKNNGMVGMDEREAAKLIMNIPKDVRANTISFLNEMMFEAGIKKDTLIYNLFLSAYASDRKYEVLCESLLEEMTASGHEPTLYTFSSLIKSHGISDNISKINETLTLMRSQYGLDPNKHIYTSVLQTCVKLKDHKQATEVFDMMKFVSQSTQPDAKAYESIILSNVEEDNIEKALDLYDEMLARQPQALKPSAETLLMLARGCTSRKELFSRGWEFIFEYSDAKFQPNAKMLETMMHLASKEGDVSFTRALFNTLMESRINDTDFNPGPVAISLLMLSYARFKLGIKTTSVMNERARLLRAKTIDVTTFNFLPPKSPPFLPVTEIVSDEAILAESNAIWAYVVLNFSDFVDEKALGSYLFAATTRGSTIDEFIKRFDTFTYLDESGIPISEDKEKGKVDIMQDDAEVSVNPIEQALKKIKSQPPAVQLSLASQFKLPRTSEFYNLAIVAAKNFKDLEFATKIWQERGRFRKSDNFRNLSHKERTTKDFEFAQYMLGFFTEMNLLEDATMVVLSSQNQFNWEWNHIKPTYQLAEISGNEDVKSYLSKAVNNENYKLRPQNTYIHPQEA